MKKNGNNDDSNEKTLKAVGNVFMRRKLNQMTINDA